MATTLQNYRDVPALNITLHHIIPSIHPHLVSCGELGFLSRGPSGEFVDRLLMCTSHFFSCPS